MKVNFSCPLMDLEGKPILRNGVDGKEAELRDFALNALNTPMAAPDGVEIKTRLFRLMIAISEGGTLDLEPEDVALIKERIAFHYSPLVMGRAFAILNG